MARFRFAQPREEGLPLLSYRFYGGGERMPSRSEEQPWQPRDIERALALIRLVFRLGEQMAVADEGEEDDEGTTGFVVLGQTWESGRERPRERKPLEVVYLSVGSFETVMAVSGVFASPTVLRYVFAVVEQAFTIRPRIRKQREEDEADRLEALVRQARAKEELVRLGAIQLRGARAPEPVAVDFWLGEGEEPPQLEAGASDPVAPN